VVSTAIFYWQRSLEQSLLLRKEKREAYRNLSQSMVGARFKALRGELSFSDEDLALQKQMYELDILGCRDLFSRVEHYRRILVETEKLVGSKDDFNDRLFERLVAKIGQAHANIVQAMQIDLQFTPTHWWQTKKRASALVNIGLVRLEADGLTVTAAPPE
jgi:hypothetical protein